MVNSLLYIIDELPIYSQQQTHSDVKYMHKILNTVSMQCMQKSTQSIHRLQV